jgi:Putative FMN-binding domain
MYVPAHFAVDDAEMRELLTGHGAADLVTTTPQGLLATLVPFVYDPAVGEHGALLGHLARNNDQWRCEVLGEAMVIVRGPDAYVSPGQRLGRRSPRRPKAALTPPTQTVDRHRRLEIGLPRPSALHPHLARIDRAVLTSR